MKTLYSRCFTILFIFLSSLLYAQVDTLLDSPNINAQVKVDYLNKKIKEKGYNWKAAITSKSHLTTDQMKIYAAWI